MGDHDEAGYASLVALATAQLCGHLLSVDPQQLAIFLDDIAAARKVGVYGVGREGLAMKGLAMRLFHMGLDAFVVGEMTAAAVGPGDVLIVSAGPGYFSTVSALAGEARRAGETLALERTCACTRVMILKSWDGVRLNCWHAHSCL